MGYGNIKKVEVFVAPPIPEPEPIPIIIPESEIIIVIEEDDKWQ